MIPPFFLQAEKNMDLSYIENLSLEDLMNNILPGGSLLKKRSDGLLWEWYSDIIGNEGWVIKQEEDESFRDFVMKVVKELIASHHMYYQHGHTSIHTGKGDTDQVDQIPDQDD